MRLYRNGPVAELEAFLTGSRPGKGQAMVQYYSLEQAAQLLRTTPDQLKEMAKKNEVRAFQDRGTLRFRSQEIDELARSRGLGSDPDLQLGEAKAAKPAAPADAGVFQFSLDEGEQAPIGREPVGTGSSKGSGRKGPKSPPPKSSDSDVRLVSDSADLDFKIAPDSDPKVAKESSKSGTRSGAGPVAQPDSGVRIVPLDKASDSDVKIVSDASDSNVLGHSPGKRPSDSDVRLEGHNLPPAAGSLHKPGSDEAMVTEEIDLDAESRKAEDAARAKGTKLKGRPKSSPHLPTTSPFELSDPDLAATKPAPPVKPAKSTTDSSSDFELSAGNKDSSPLSLSDEEVALGEVQPAGSGDSGINLQDPADSGISLEQGGGDDIEFELSLDKHSTPKPAPVKQEDSDSEFELSLDVDSSSELEAAKQAASDSDSEFELTLDESGELAPMEDSGAREKDIFETDFEVPALDEESGSEAVALEDSDSVDDSDFDLALSDEDVGSEDSGSQVVALGDEDETGENAATVARPRRGAGAAVAEQELEDDLGEEGEAVGAPAAEAPPAEWGALPALVLLPCAIVLFLVTLMSFELLQGMWGYHRGSSVPGLIANPLAKMIAGQDSVPKD